MSRNPVKRREYYMANRAKRREYYMANRAKILEKQAKYRAENPEKVREQHRKASAKYLAANPDAYRKAHLRRNYGISAQEYDLLWLAQGGGCAICGQDCPSGGWLSVDHDHASGSNRGLLCGHHNRGLGLFQEDPALLRKAADYLEFHNKLQATPGNDIRC